MAAAVPCAACGAPSADRPCRRCSGEVRYCGPECAEAHWPVHRPVCGVVLSRGPRGFSREAAAALPPPPPGGLRDLAAAGAKLDAEAAWEAQQAGEAAAAASCRPRLHALMLCVVADEEALGHLAACVSSVCKQWRAPPEHTLVSWHAEDESLRSKVRELLSNFRSAVEGGSPYVAYNEGPARAVLCEVTALEQPSPLSPGEHARLLLQRVPASDSSWVLLCQGDGLWHPGRTAFFRNFTRQVPGPEECVATVAPVLVQPSAAGLRGPVRQAIEVNKLMGQGDPSVELVKEACGLPQLCLRRAFLEEFFESHGEARAWRQAFATRLCAYTLVENGPRTRQVDAAQFREVTQYGAAMWTWMYFHRRGWPDVPRATLTAGRCLPWVAPAGEATSALRCCVEYFAAWRGAAADPEALAEEALALLQASPAAAPGAEEFPRSELLRFAKGVATDALAALRRRS